MPHPARPAVQGLTLLALLVATPLVAQRSDSAAITVRGTLVDANTGSPLVGALVWSGDRSTLTDEAGRFALSGMRPGHGTVSFEQLGYTPISLSQVYGPDDPPLQVELEPQPVVLEGLTVMADRLKARREATGVAVRVLDQDDMRREVGDGLDLLRRRGGMGLTACRSRRSLSAWCVYSRGRIVEPTLYIDDRPAFAGVEVLMLYQPAELYAVEIYRGGQHVRVYTRQYMQTIAMHPRPAPPLTW